MKKWNIALGFYQEHSTAKAVVKELKRKNFTRFAIIRNKKGSGIQVERNVPASVSLILLAVLTIAVGLLLLNYFQMVYLSWLPLAVGIGLALALAGIYAYLRFSMIDSDVVNQFKSRVIVDEILVIAQVSQEEVRDALATLRQVKSGHPVTFLLRTDAFEEGNVDIHSEPVTPEQLSQDARRLAAALQHVGTGQDYKHSLIKRFQKNTGMLQKLRNDVADAEFIEQTVPLSADWLLDNMYVLEGAIEDVKQNLPKSYYKILPKISEGTLAGFPRVYALAIELIQNTAGGLNSENISLFLKSYQTVHPLTLGELWAFPLMLRYRLIEWVEYLAVHVDNRMREGELASFWGNRLLYAARHEPERLEEFLSDLFNVQTPITSHFAEELIDHLFDEETILPLVRKRLEERFSQPLADVLHQEHIHETSEQVVFSNSIRSLITLSQISWRDILEDVSPVDAILRDDPDQVYSKMDFTTRNTYRSVIEEISRGSHMPEVDVAGKALLLASKGERDFNKHIGYYLIDDGRLRLEHEVAYRPGFIASMRRWITKHAALVYLGGITFLTLLLESLALKFLINSGAGLFQTILFALLALAPLSELSIQVVNLLLTMILPSPLRPKMSFDAGIPEVYKTLVVVPMLFTQESIKEESERLEIRYLANTDPQLCFGLFGDFTDAPKQHMQDDAALLALAADRINALEAKYGPGKFFLFSRQRVWSDCENAWIGWERKRGKLEYLNCYLMGESLPENIIYAGQAEALKGIRYVITLDADTQLPKDQARALVEVLSHPLNRPYLNADKKALERGYTIIQPRVGTDFVHSKASWFSRIFSDPTAADPYTLAISNIYQDLTGEGSYHGKGIYDVEAFHNILSHHFPEGHLLSHDLIEGSFVRVGFASNVCLFDMHPKDYLSWAKRQHRWIRGDWQNSDWILSDVPVAMGRTEANTLSWINRWKIIDNLRRAVTPVSLLLLLVLGWTVSNIHGIWTALAWIVILLPFISLCINKLISISNTAIKSSLVDLNVLILRTLINISMLPYEAYLSVDAICRVIYRRLISHCNLLQWTASEQSSQTEARTHKKFILQLGLVSIFALAIFGYLFITHPVVAKLALPFCLLWFAAPFTLYMIDKPLEKPLDEDVTDADRTMLRKIARKTWRYFDDLVGPQTHWMPPDNYQLALNVEVAQRTSPTNIGMWFTAVISAYDLRYINCDTFIDKTLATIDELKKLERYQGHFLNWYNIQTLDPLFPRYVSTVDSGNLLACLWTLEQGLLEVLASPVIPSDALLGIKDTYEILHEIKETPTSHELEQLVDSHPSEPAHFSMALKKVSDLVAAMPFDKANPYWLKQLQEQLDNWQAIYSRYFSWIDVLNCLSNEQLLLMDPNAPQWREKALAWKPSLQDLAGNSWIDVLDHLINAAQKPGLSNEIKAWARKLLDTISTARWLAGEKIGLARQIFQSTEAFSREMNLKFLYNDDRKLFAIGYNVDERRLDSSHYDLLASEARIASLVGIAKEDVPLEHWWALGRQYSIVEGRKVLLSWGGTMFEYLMPLIFNRQYSDSLIGDACTNAVACQIAYGEKRGIPWGVSESAFSAIDSHKIYQYKSFGIPGLGLKRGLEEDLVVSPYSSALSLAVNPKAALKNLRRLAANHLNLMGPYGYYESVDFTRQRSPKGERGVIVYAYMAHHQGMALASIDNILTNGAMIKRFHKDPRVSGVSSILYESIPYSVPVKITEGRKAPTLRRLEPFSQSPIMGVVETPESVTPKINLLSNGNYSVMISNTGAGYSRWGDIDIYRWRADTTRDHWGSYCYIRDMKTNKMWSTTYQPTQTIGRGYSANFKADKSEFTRKDHQIETITEVIVSPEDNAEIRLVTLINRSEEFRSIELTSYLELVLATHAADRSHPSFNKLFIETEAVPDHSALIAFRRLRSPEDAPICARWRPF